MYNADMQTASIDKFLLVSIIPKGVSDEAIFAELKELKELVESYGGKVKEFVTQRREIHDKGKYIGEGKIQEVLEIVKKEKIDVVVLNGIIKPGHLFDLQSILYKVNPQIRVWDRSDLILEIFAKHAHTAEAKLQIDLAAMRHMGPRIYGMGMVLSSQGGGIGTRGVGETNTELMRRHWREQMKKTQEKLKKLSHQREQQLKRRQRVGMASISLVGYTNAGKTSLFNVLSGRGKLAHNSLFATLDTTTSKLYLEGAKTDILLSDTIGFIQNLPPTLIDAFTSTLIESINADLLLVVIDSSDPLFREKIEVVESTLRSLPVKSPERIYVFNKVDKDSLNRSLLKEEFAAFSPQFVSSISKEGLEDLKAAIKHHLLLSISHA